MAKLAELLDTSDPHTIVRFSTSDDVLRFPVVTKLYDESTQAPGSETQATNTNKIFLNQFTFINVIKSWSFLLDAAVVDGVVVVVTEHISIKDKGTQTGDEQQALITQTDFGDGHPEPLVVHTSNNEQGGAGAHTLEPDEVLNE